MRNEWRQFCRQKITGQLNDSAEPFQVSELETALENLKSGTAAGYDNILPELLKHMGPRAKLWIKLPSSSGIVHEKRIPETWPSQNQAKGKDHSVAANYQPISLLSVCFKCLERLILQRIKPDLEESTIVEKPVSDQAAAPAISSLYMASSLNRKLEPFSWIQRQHMIRSGT